MTSSSKFDEWARRLLLQTALREEFAILATALERVIAQHRKVLPASGGTAVCAECGQDRWDKRLCGTLQVLADALNWQHGQLSQLSGTASGGQVRQGDAAIEVVFDEIRPQVWRFEDWVFAAGQVPNSQRPRLEERDASVWPSQAGNPQAGGDAHLSAGSGVGPEQAGGAGNQEGRRIRLGWPLGPPPAVERADEQKEEQ